MRTQAIISTFLGFCLSMTAFADGMKVNLGGYCPVAYVSAEKAIFGKPEFASEHQGRTYYFVAQGAKDTFDKDPSAFVKAIQYDAWCATGLAMGKKIASDPKIFTKLDGKVYFFSSQGAKEAFDKDSATLIKKADKEWSKEG